MRAKKIVFKREALTAQNDLISIVQELADKLVKLHGRALEISWYDRSDKTSATVIANKLCKMRAEARKMGSEIERVARKIVCDIPKRAK